MFLPSPMLEIRTGLNQRITSLQCAIYTKQFSRAPRRPTRARGFINRRIEEWIAKYQNCVFGKTKLIWKSMLNCDARGANWR
jgi:hypothetical protein